MVVLPGNVGVDCTLQPRFANLPQQGCTEARPVERSGTEGDQGFVSRLRVRVLVHVGNPLREHRQSATCLLKLTQGLPLAMEDGEGRGMERIASLEPCSQELPRLRIRRCTIDRSPLRRELVTSFEAPVRIGFRYRLADS